MRHTTGKAADAVQRLEQVCESTGSCNEFHKHSLFSTPEDSDTIHFFLLEPGKVLCSERDYDPSDEMMDNTITGPEVISEQVTSNP
jgi:hypothetical protein